MLLEDLAPTLKRLRRSPLLADDAGIPVAHGRDALQRLLPHRPPLLLVDRIDAIDPQGGSIRGRRWLDPDDAVFAGHFPGDPVYPGVLVVEAMGQLAATLPHFFATKTTDVPRDVRPQRLRATRIHHAAFFLPFLPGDTMLLHATVLSDGLTLVAGAQAWRGDALAVTAVMEVLGDD